MVALGPIRSTAIDGLSEKLPFDQIYGQFFLLLEAPCLAVIDDCIAPCAPHWDSAIGDSFDSFDINIGEISDQDGYCCRVNRNFYFIYVPVPVINRIITVCITVTVPTRLPGLPDTGLYGDGT